MGYFACFIKFPGEIRMAFAGKRTRKLAGYALFSTVGVLTVLVPSHRELVVLVQVFQ